MTLGLKGLITRTRHFVTDRIKREGYKRRPQLNESSPTSDLRVSTSDAIRVINFWGAVAISGKQWWSSGYESTRAPYPVLSVSCWFSPCSEVFTPGCTLFLPPRKPTLLNSDSIVQRLDTNPLAWETTRPLPTLLDV